MSYTVFFRSVLVLGSFLLLGMGTLAAQSEALPVDSAKNQAAIRLLDKLVVNDHLDPLYNRISVFGNVDCHRCHELDLLLRNQKIDFDDYDLRDLRLMSRLFDFMSHQKGAGDMSFSFPVVLYKGELFYNITDFQEFIRETQIFERSE